MTLQLGMVTIDCEDPHKLAAFWCEALGVEIADDYGEYVMLTSRTEGGVRLAMQRVPEPRTGKNRVHVDFGTDDREGEVARLVGLGATALADHEMPGLNWTVLADPEGNEFCVGSHHE
ncbi:glyoxalase [Prauserella sp. PE36]|uniref:VOC family protein n=1 Tax=Prauserella endophytica TaxID=1592324 RepID=A0ABY2S6U5_9PSEU|nr:MULTISPECIES: VOC family protein [Prauserella]PXY21636.1 glyoxalase [Prauserella coralliicola]RBM20011.1 glyoxalase [Prauserella sp. PE36]TKG71418.1 VOC family protein [Prauserella endophytica]